MTREDIIAMALKAELIYDEQCSSPWVENTNLIFFLERFAALVASAERKQIIEIAESSEFNRIRGEFSPTSTDLVNFIKAMGKA